MDFKSLVSKINQLNDPVENVQAPTLPQSIQLNEDAQMRVLAGQTTIVAETAKMKKEAEVKEEMKVGDKKSSSTGGTIEKTKTGVKHTAGKNYGGDKAPADSDEDEPTAKKSKKAKSESIEEASDAKKAAQDKFKAMIAKKKGEKKDVKEGAKPDFLDMDKDGDKKEPMKKAVADKKKGSAPKKGVNPFAKKTESAMMPKGKKRPVKESVEGKLTFKEMIKLVQESGGQQQIDPVDTALFTWAQRVAAAKFTESAKAEVYAGLIYERNGGIFEMYDVLSENQK
jgi:hypothetical protein